MNYQKAGCEMMDIVKELTRLHELAGETTLLNFCALMQNELRKLIEQAQDEAAVQTKPATKEQLIALRDALLRWHDKDAAAACENLIDLLSKRASVKDGEYFGVRCIVSGGEVLELDDDHWYHDNPNY